MPTKSSLKARAGLLAAALLLANLGVWLWAWVSLGQHPVLLGTAFLAYTLGLRHAVDADHIAAIDSVTRKLMREGKRPIGVGFYFSLGHSSVVFALSAAVALTSITIQLRFGALETVGRLLGTALSVFFLLVFAGANLLILIPLHRAFQAARQGVPVGEGPMDLILAGSGPIGRAMRRVFHLIGHSWQMFPVGLLFGLGFDTATEIALLGISAAEASKGLGVWSIMVFPALFTAGMVLVDSADSVLMVGAYAWAFDRPWQRLYYNLTMTAASVILAFLVGAVELLGLLGNQLRFGGPWWAGIEALNSHMGAMGALAVAVFALTWLCAVIYLRGEAPAADGIGMT